MAPCTQVLADRESKEQDATEQPPALDQAVDEKTAECDAAMEKLAAARKTLNDVQKHDKFFSQNVRLRDAVDEMIKRLQRWKSAIKLVKSFEKAKMIFKQWHVPRRGPPLHLVRHVLH
jgi:hypothetical protein